MTKVTDRLADKTGLGEAVVGALFLGGSTSLSGIVTSVTAAAGGYAELAISNALGGIAAQTAFLSVADIVYRKANLEHAAASPANLTQGTLLLTLLTISLLAMAGPQVSVCAIYPASAVILVPIYLDFECFLLLGNTPCGTHDALLARASTKWKKTLPVVLA